MKDSDYFDREYVTICVAEIRRETDKAFLCILEDDEECWIPKSQIHDYDQYSDGDCDIEMEVTEWIAEQKGLA